MVANRKSLFPERKTEEELNKLSLNELIEIFHPEDLTTNLRWTDEIAYQKSIAERIAAILEKDPNIESSIPKAIIYQKLADAFCETGEYAKAEGYLTKSFLLISDLYGADKNPDFKKQAEIKARCFLHAGVIKRLTSIQKSLKQLNEGLQECEAFKNLPSLDKEQDLKKYYEIKANLLRNKGIAYLSEKKYAEASKYFQQCADVVRESLKTSSHLSLYLLPILTYQGLAYTLQAEGEKNNTIKASLLKQAAVFFEEAEKGYTKEGIEILKTGCEDFASFAAHYAKFCLITRNYKEALKWYSIAFDIRNNLKGQHRDRVIDVLIGLGRTYSGLLDIAKAREQLNSANEELDKLPKTDTARTNTVKDYLDRLQSMHISNSLRQFGDSNKYKEMLLKDKKDPTNTFKKMYGNN